MWFDKEHSDTLYIDIREVDPGTSAHRPNWSVEPDMVADYRNLPFKDEKFELIVW